MVVRGPSCSPARPPGEQRSGTATKSGSCKPNPASGPRHSKCGGGVWLPIGPNLGVGSLLLPAPNLHRVKCTSRGPEVLFIEGRGVGLFTLCYWLDLNRPDCGPAAGQGSRRLRLAPDSFGEARPARDTRPELWDPGDAGTVGGCGQRRSAGRSFRPCFDKL